MDYQCAVNDEIRFDQTLAHDEEERTMNIIEKMQIDRVNVVICTGTIDSFCMKSMEAAKSYNAKFALECAANDFHDAKQLLALSLQENNRTLCVEFNSMTYHRW